MSEQLTPTLPAAGERTLRPSLLQGAVVIVLFAVAGLGCGWLWHHLYDAPQGIAYDGRWIGLDAEQVRRDFSGTASYVLIGFAAAVVLGLVSAVVLDRDELVTLAAVAAGAVLASVLMAWLGSHLGHPDPDMVAAGAKDGTKIPGDLHVAGLSVYFVWPAGALLSLLVVFFSLGRRQRD
ncbi:MAG: hypothetical protein F2667_01065 [Actinobacteria bacterium]|uniref:Unannotated protein n=1 Tax=freshwater metagenome TaxID=449393 RepID=A0A6J6NRT8_9ZZZZ|nr:hypothetical protein [Actinomycetota bacterium]